MGHEIGHVERRSGGHAQYATTPLPMPASGGTYESLGEGYGEGIAFESMYIKSMTNDWHVQQLLWCFTCFCTS
jgi:hypothetical protein